MLNFVYPTEYLMKKYEVEEIAVNASVRSAAIEFFKIKTDYVRTKKKQKLSVVELNTRDEEVASNTGNDQLWEKNQSAGLCHHNKWS